jgi:hypothetical protein
MDRMYDERHGDIHFDEEDPQSEFYNPKCIRDLYIDLANGVFDRAFDLNSDDNYYEDDAAEYYDADDDNDDDIYDDADDDADKENYYINGDDISNYEDVSNNQKEIDNA